MAHKSNKLGEPTSQIIRTSERGYRLYVGNLLASTTDEQLYNYFRKFGALQQVCIPESVRRKSRMFAFVEFVDQIDAMRAFHESSSIPFSENHFLRVEKASQAKEKNAQIKKKSRTRFRVIIADIPTGTDIQEIIKLASPFGRLLKIAPFKTGSTSKIGCRVKFEFIESAHKLLQQKHLVLASGAVITVKPYFLQSRKEGAKIHQAGMQLLDTPPMQSVQAFGRFCSTISTLKKTITVRKFLSIEVGKVGSEETLPRTTTKNPVIQSSSVPPQSASPNGLLPSMAIDDRTNQNLLFNLRSRC